MATKIQIGHWVGGFALGMPTLWLLQWLIGFDFGENNWLVWVPLMVAYSYTFAVLDKPEEGADRVIDGRNL